MPRCIALFVLCCLLGGCATVVDSLTLAADGSSTVELDVMPAPGFIAEEIPSLDFWAHCYPPLQANLAYDFFAGKVQSVQRRADGGYHVTAHFPDPASLMNSRYGQAHQLRIETVDGYLTVKAIAGGQVLAPANATAVSISNASECKVPWRNGNGINATGRDADEVRKLIAQAKVTFQVKLPRQITGFAPIIGSRAMVADGSATLICVRAAEPDDEHFRLHLGQPLVARCALPPNFPKTDPPLRLGLYAFAGVPVGATAIKTQFVPPTVTFSSLVTHRSSSPNEGENSCELTVSATVAETHAPLYWSGIHLSKALDDQGNNLLPTNEVISPPWRVPSLVLDPLSLRVQLPSGEEQPDYCNYIPLLFLADDFSCRIKPPAISSAKLTLSGSLACLYLTQRIIVAMPGIIDPSVFPRTRDLTAGKMERLSPSSCVALSNNLTINTAARTNHAVMFRISYSTSSADALPRSLETVQVFDHRGNHLPTVWSRQIWGNDLSWDVVVLLSDEKPLSLALEILVPGTPVQVPVEIANFPWRGQPEAQP